MKVQHCNLRALHPAHGCQQRGTRGEGTPLPQKKAAEEHYGEDPSQKSISEIEKQQRLGALPPPT